MAKSSRSSFPKLKVKSKMQNDRAKVKKIFILSYHFNLCPLIFKFR
jgi:hypothetical protein